MIPNNVAEITIQYSANIPPEKRRCVRTSQESYAVFLDNWIDNTWEYQEVFRVLYLNRANDVLGIKTISMGGTSATVVDAKHVFGIAITSNASGIILAHNHPSGRLVPSKEDYALTQRLKKIGELLDIFVLDHLILSPFHYFSFADEGHL